jgi:hypothetical protein
MGEHSQIKLGLNSVLVLVEVANLRLTATALRCRFASSTTPQRITFPRLASLPLPDWRNNADGGADSPPAAKSPKEITAVFFEAKISIGGAWFDETPDVAVSLEETSSCRGADPTSSPNVRH